jgi:hypothetical protein
MADLNKSMQEVQERFSRIKIELRKLFMDYDGVFKEVNRLYSEERMVSGTTVGLEDFHRLLQIMRRNRDVIGSLVRGSDGIRSVDRFRFVEEDVSESKIEKKKPHLPREKSTLVPGGPIPVDPKMTDSVNIEKVEELI